MPLIYECSYCERRDSAGHDDDHFCSICELQICSGCGLIDDRTDDWYCQGCYDDVMENRASADPTDPLFVEDDPWDDPGAEGA